MLIDKIPSIPPARWMCFIDGENLTARAQRIERDREVHLEEGPWYVRDTFLWFPQMDVLDVILSTAGVTVPHHNPARSYYYASVRGDQVKLQETREKLRALGFQPEVFSRSKDDTKSKGLDLSIARDILSHAFRDNYDVMVLIAGDGDYVPLLEEVKRLGKICIVGFFEKEGLNPELRLAADQFAPIDWCLMSKWKPRDASPFKVC
jgi:hypothetical protein